MIWLTDIHLNFLEKEDRLSFYQEIIDAAGDAVCITGDIAEAPSVLDLLEEMATAVNKPIYFVLGNHDYYDSDVAAVRDEIKTATNNNPLLHWLPVSGPHDLGKGTMLLGEDCWADGRNGNYANSPVVLNDSRMIRDLYEGRICGKFPLLDAMQKLADGDAEHLKNSVCEAIKKYQPHKIVILTHVPPFRETCMHEGEMSNDDYLPFFSSKVLGDTLLELARQNTSIQFLVFSGHTHSDAYFQPLDNLTVRVGSAEYLHPAIQEVIVL